MSCRSGLGALGRDPKVHVVIVTKVDLSAPRRDQLTPSNFTQRDACELNALRNTEQCQRLNVLRECVTSSVLEPAQLEYLNISFAEKFLNRKQIGRFYGEIFGVGQRRTVKDATDIGIGSSIIFQECAVCIPE